MVRSILKILRLLLLLFPGAVLLSCETGRKHVSSFDEDTYMAHLQLDSSVLIITEIADSLEVPWEITFGPDGWLWFTEQNGTVNRLNPETGERQALLHLDDVSYKKSRGLLGMALHPDLETEPYVFLYYNFAFNDKEFKEVIKSRVVRYTWQEDKLIDPMILLDSIPGKTYHNGSRMIILPDHTLLFSTGDVGAPKLSQDPGVITGKLLRMNLDGTVPKDNPFPGSLVFSWGHRNPQGLVFASNGNLYSSEHGPNNDDEVNLIQMGNNYGWPFVEGFADKDNEKLFAEDSTVTEPLFAWTPTIAPAGLDYYDHAAIPEWQNSLLLVSLKGQAFRVLKLNKEGDAVQDEHVFLQKYFGRMRDLAVSPDGDIYLSTSNEDWHPRLQSHLYDSLPAGGDRIIRLRKAGPAMLAQLQDLPNAKRLFEDHNPVAMATEVNNVPPSENVLEHGKNLYTQHCLACHMEDGSGIKNLTPPLSGTSWVVGDKTRLIQVLLQGLSEPIEVKGERYEQEMPAYAWLSDEELANVLTYIRQSFGNDANAVIAGEVYEERKDLR